jgi:hypothetical protein
VTPRADIKLTGSALSANPLKACQGRCNGAQRVPEGGVQVNPSKWVCAACGAQLLRRFR